MITAEAFKSQWKQDEGHELVAYEAENLANTPLHPSTKAFLAASGLPAGCAPFLSFNEKLYSEYIRNIKEYYDLSTDHFNPLYSIGSSDNVSICIDTSQTDKIVEIDIDYIYTIENGDESPLHEEYIPVRFVNTSVAHLAHCLLVYRRFVETTRSARDGQSFLEIQPTPEEWNQLETALYEADGQCLSASSFWRMELDMLKYR